VFRVEMLPAEQGDALWIEYGSGSRPHRVLIDAGVRGTADVVKARAATLTQAERRFDLLVVTHVDSDHIGGIPQLLADRSLGLHFDDVWFNAWRHLPKVGDLLGPVEGEIVSAELDRNGSPWNAAFDGRPVYVPGRGRLPRTTLRGGMTLTLLSPTPAGLEKLRPEWEATVRAAGLDPGSPDAALAEAARRRGVPDLLGDVIDVDALASSKLVADRAAPNGSTIAFLAEFEGTSCVFTGDAHPDVLREGLERLCSERKAERLRVDALKVPHHGSKHNVSTDVVDLLDTSRFLFSSNGRQTNHPDPEGVARTIARSDAPTLYFNYRTDRTDPWDDPRLMARYRYGAVYPEGETVGLAVEL
jgi:beta-lactamase superfamily II metal-dependent hydrolase